MKIKTKLLVVASMILVTAQTAFAVKVVSDVKLTDGTHIRKCQFNNGVVKYCTQEDAINDMRAFNNFSLIPQSEVKKTGQQLYKMTGDKSFLESPKYNNSKNDEANKKAIQAEKIKFQTEFPVAKKIEATLAGYEKEFNELSRKSGLGLPYDEERYTILESKINVLKELDGEGAEYTNPYVTGYSSLTIIGIQGAYNNLSDKLKKKEITQDEFNYLKAKLVINAGQLEATYNKVLNSQGKVLFAGESQTNNQNMNNGTATQINVNDTKLDKARKGVGTGVNILNDTMNSVRSIQSMFGL